jgi:hypothetical protein
MKSSSSLYGNTRRYGAQYRTNRMSDESHCAAIPHPRDRNALGTLRRISTRKRARLLGERGLPAQSCGSRASVWRPSLPETRSREWATRHIEGSLNIPLNHLQERIAEIPRDRRIAVHCAVRLPLFDRHQHPGSIRDHPIDRDGRRPRRLGCRATAGGFAGLTAARENGRLSRFRRMTLAAPRLLCRTVPE